MFESIQRKRASDSTPTIDVTPLIDVVFILLLFFLVTTTFVKDTGIEVDRPQASSGKPLEGQSLRIGIASSGGIYIDGRRRDLSGVREVVTSAATRNEDLAVVVVPDDRVAAGRLIAVMDTVKLAGAANVAVATRRKGTL